jgi:gamma-glutamyl-gamma-aminobutyraldehyde dehydrogenase
VITVDDLDEALAIANDTDYGLGAAIWTERLHDGHRATRALRAGTVWVNCYDHTSINAPFGGYKQSGQSRNKRLQALLHRFSRLPLEHFCQAVRGVRSFGQSLSQHS